MKIDVYLTPRPLADDALKGKTVVLVDVLRSCSTITTALAHGARAVVPAGDLIEAGRIAAGLDPETSLRGGERSGKPIDGYDVGNSPLEYSSEHVAGKTILLTTTNGTALFALARRASSAVAGCFLNAGRVVDFLRRELADTARDAQDDEPAQAAIVCAGQGGHIALEDVLCAGMLLHRLWGDDVPADLSDGAHIALAQYRHDRHRLARALYGCTHTQRLIELGYGDDVAYCAGLDKLPVLPRYKDSRLVLDAADRAFAAERVAADQAAAEQAELGASEDTDAQAGATSPPVESTALEAETVEA